MKLLFAAIALFLATQAHASPLSPWSRSGVTPVNCTMISTATALTEVTGCAAVSGKSYYITSIQWSSSIISTTTNFFLLQSGTGTNCATATTSLYAGFAEAAFVERNIVFPVPIKATVSHALCFVHPGAGTRNVNVQGFYAD